MAIQRIVKNELVSRQIGFTTSLVVTPKKLSLPFLLSFSFQILSFTQISIHQFSFFSLSQFQPCSELFLITQNPPSECAKINSIGFAYTVSTSQAGCGAIRGSFGLFAFSVDKCVGIQNATALSYLVFALYLLRLRPLLGYRYTSLSALQLFPSFMQVVSQRSLIVNTHHELVLNV